MKEWPHSYFTSPAAGIPTLSRVLDIILDGLSDAEARHLFIECPLLGFTAMHWLLFKPEDWTRRGDACVETWLYLRDRFDLAAPDPITIGLAGYYGDKPLLSRLLPLCSDVEQLSRQVTLGPKEANFLYWPVTGTPGDLAAWQGYTSCVDLITDFAQKSSSPSSSSTAEAMDSREPVVSISEVALQVAVEIRRQAVATLEDPRRPICVIDERALEVGEELGAGAFGHVHKAVWWMANGWGMVVAVKKLPLVQKSGDLTLCVEKLEMMVAEFIMALSFMKAEGICVPSNGITSPELWIISDLYAGTLKALLTKAGSDSGDCQVTEVDRRRILEDVSEVGRPEA